MTTRKLLLYMAAVWVFSGVADALLHVSPYGPSPLGIVQWWVTGVLLYRWCRTFSERVGVEPWFGVPVLVALLAPVGLPVYLFQVLPAKRATLAMFSAIAILVVMLLLYGIAGALTQLIAA